MREKFSDLYASLKAMWQNATRKARIAFLVATAAILIFCLVVVVLLNRTNYVLLFNYNNLSAQESASVIAALNEVGIDPKVESTGAIYVTDKEIDRARMQMAVQGYSNSGLEYETYNSIAGSLTATQTDKETAKLNDLQDRLQATIQTFDEVNKAIVNINPGSSGTFALDTSSIPPSASITITKKRGAQLTKEQIQGILNIVKNSVAGLTEENISITDSESGDLLPYLDSSASAANKLELTEQVNAAAQQKILSLLGPVYGFENVKVAVSSQLDNNQEVTESSTYRPFDENNPRNNPVEREEHYREKQGGGDGVAQGVPGANDNVDVPQYSAEALDVTDGDAYVAESTYNYLVSSVWNQVVKEGYDITDMTVAVVVNKQNFANDANNDERSKIIDLVSGASGLSNDKISVQNIQFYNQSPLDQADLNGTPDELNLMLVLAVVGGLVALFLILGVIFAVLNQRRKRAELLALEGAMYPGDGLLVDLEDGGVGEEGADALQEGDSFEPIVLAETPEQKLKAQIRDLAESDPEIVAQLIKTWLVNG